jgi:hypothetical protein
VLGHGDALSSPVPRILRMFDSKRVIEIGAGFQHVLVLTEHDGVLRSAMEATANLAWVR